MSSICLIGGKLQGFEVTYLARKAGMEVVLVDRKKRPLIRNVVDRFYCFDIIQDPERLIEISRDVDAIIPVNENLATLDFIRRITPHLDCPVLFDHDAYHVSMDKLRSRRYFASIGIPIPAGKPTAPPYFVKPPCESSSVGARIIHTDEELSGLDPGMVIEEYVSGDVVSLEVVGDGEHFAVGKETKVHIDDTYDCHMITPIPHDQTFRRIAYELAVNLSLKGIMDVEAIASPEGLRVIEIDARFPSQTPTVVYHSSGINLLKLLMQAFTDGVSEIDMAPEQNYCIFEHLLAVGEELTPVGEHVLSQGDDYTELHIGQGLELFVCRGDRTVYTLICWGGDQMMVEARREEGITLIREHYRKMEGGIK
ncbi:MAG: 3-methylornithine--L-lysine ligase PylC [Methanosarcinaceae archaeon]|nr:3-methylornithine--L-lysine ligase PylC [Methanosarcinaceae archaeon]